MVHMRKVGDQVEIEMKLMILLLVALRLCCLRPIRFGPFD